MYALVEIKGKQYKAEKGALIKVDKMENDEGAEVEFDTVMLLGGIDKVKVGTPYVKGAKVKAVVESQQKGKKIIIYKYKRRKGYRRKQGHRQQYSYLRIADITGS
jgi:large subunit ribosomal protein L21